MLFRFCTILLFGSYTFAFVSCSNAARETNSQKIFPWDSPVAFQPNEKRKQPCQPIYYGRGNGDGVLDPQCFDLQEKLASAASEGQNDKVKELLRDGANINGAAGDSFRALECASMEGHLSTTLLLLNNGAEINHYHFIRGSALSKAVYGGHLEVTELLLSRGANPTIKFDGGNVLAVAKNLKNERMIKLIEKYWPNQSEMNASTNSK